MSPVLSCGDVEEGVADEDGEQSTPALLFVAGEDEEAGMCSCTPKSLRLSF